jgi:hypothetical protein
LVLGGSGWIFNLGTYIIFFFFYSYVHTMFGSFLPLIHHLKIMKGKTTLGKTSRTAMHLVVL